MPWHTSPWVHWLPSSQSEPAGAGAGWQPVRALQLVDNTQGPPAGQTFAAPEQTPPVQVSFSVQTLPSVHCVPVSGDDWHDPPTQTGVVRQRSAEPQFFGVARQTPF